MTNKEISYGIFNPGDMFIVNNKIKSSVFLPDTLGFIQYNLKSDYNNIVTSSVVIIRKGKHGVSRLEQKILFTPALYFDDKIVNDCLPTDLRELVFINKVSTKLNIIKTSDINFMGWVCSYAQYLYKIYGMFAIYKTNNNNNLWPESNNHILNRMLRLNLTFRENNKTTFNLFLDNTFRENIIKSLRKMETHLINAIVSYKIDYKYRFIQHAIQFVHNRITNRTMKTELANAYTEYSNKESAAYVFLQKRLH